MSNGDQTTKQGLSPLAWVAIGCGALAVLAIVLVAGVVGFGIFKAKEVIDEFQENPAKTAAETMIKLNPDLDLVSTDDAAGTVTFKNKQTGEIATMNFDDIAEGKWSITTEEGEFTVDASQTAEGGGVTLRSPEGEARFGAGAGLGDVPDWVPIYPDASETQGTYSSKTAQGMTGMIAAKTADGSQAVIDHYRQWFEDNGYEILNTTSSTTPDGSISSISGELAAEGRTLTVGVIEQGGEVNITLNYNAEAR